MSEPPKPAQLDKLEIAARELRVDENNQAGFAEVVTRVAAPRPNKDAKPEKAE